MIKRTLCFSNPAYLSTRHRQLVVEYPNSDQAPKTVPIEDIGVVVLEDRQITISNGLIDQLAGNKVAIITCDARHMPKGLLLPIEGHTLQSEYWDAQLEATKTLRNQLWKQTVEAKIRNQMGVLRELEQPFGKLKNWSKMVKPGDADNLEANAASYYFKRAFPEYFQFKRDSDGAGVNAMLNYGYAVLRAVIARALCSSGLLLTRGIFHHNKYNAFCLADDVMEPYRPYVDVLVRETVLKFGSETELTPEIKRELLTLPQVDVRIGRKLSPLLVAASRTSASLVKCFLQEKRKISYPVYG